MEADEDVIVANLGDWRFVVELERVEAILTFYGPLLHGRGRHTQLRMGYSFNACIERNRGSNDCQKEFSLGKE